VEENVIRGGKRERRKREIGKELSREEVRKRNLKDERTMEIEKMGDDQTNERREQ